MHKKCKCLNIAAPRVLFTLLQSCGPEQFELFTSLLKPNCAFKVAPAVLSIYMHAVLCTGPLEPLT